MKRWIAFLMAAVLLFSLCACGMKRPGTPYVSPGGNTTTTKEAQPEPDYPDANEPEETDAADAWKAQYQQALQNLLDAGTPISGAWVYDVDGDGIPLVALSITQYAVHPMPEYLLNYKNGQLIVKDDIELGGTGGSINNRALFVSGTDYLITRMQGMTVGTFLDNETTVFAPSAQGDTYTAVETFSVDTTQIEEEANARFENDPSADASDFIARIAEETDQRIAKYAPDGKFYDYADEMTEFVDFDDEDFVRQMRSAVGYLEHALGITLTLDESLYADVY